MQASRVPMKDSIIVFNGHGLREVYSSGLIILNPRTYGVHPGLENASVSSILTEFCYSHVSCIPSGIYFHLQR